MSSDRFPMDSKRVSADVASQLNSMMQVAPKKVRPASTELSLRDLIGTLYDSIMQMKAKGYSAADICEFISKHSATSIAPGTLNNYLGQEGKKRKQQRRQQQRNKQGVKQSIDTGSVIESGVVTTTVHGESSSPMTNSMQSNRKKNSLLESVSSSAEANNATYSPPVVAELQPTNIAIAQSEVETQDETSGGDNIVSEEVIQNFEQMITQASLDSSSSSRTKRRSRFND